MTFPVVYNRATKPAKTCQPGAKALMAWCLHNTTATNLGCYVNRPIRGGARLSVHAEGRALDLGFPHTVGGTEEGWALAHLFRQHHAALGIQYIIYSRRKWSGVRDDEGWRYYGGASPHYEHIHVELNKRAAAELTADMIATTLGDTTMTPDQIATVKLFQQGMIDRGHDLPRFGADGDPGHPDNGETIEAYRAILTAYDQAVKDAKASNRYKARVAELTNKLARKNTAAVVGASYLETLRLASEATP